MAQPEGSANPHPLPTNRVLPHVVMPSIRDRFYAGLTAAEHAFGFNCAEEMF